MLEYRCRERLLGMLSPAHEVPVEGILNTEQRILPLQQYLFEGQQCHLR